MLCFQELKLPENYGPDFLSETLPHPPLVKFGARVPVGKTPLSPDFTLFCYYEDKLSDSMVVCKGSMKFY